MKSIYSSADEEILNCKRKNKTTRIEAFCGFVEKWLHLEFYTLY